jgi:hypothetical protein
LLGNNNNGRLKKRFSQFMCGYIVFTYTFQRIPILEYELNTL